MSFVCLWIPPSPTGEGANESPAAGGEAHPPGEGRAALAAALLAVSPHVAVDARGLIWVDARGLSAEEVGGEVLALATRHGVADARVGGARVALVAELATRIVPAAIVAPGEERAFLATRPLGVLADAAPVAPSPRLRAALADVGLECCAELAALTLEEVEVRFGEEGVALWRLARGEDARRIFAPRSRALPSASLAWEEYALRDVERLAFVVNRLAGTVCAELQGWGEGARGMTLTLALADRTTVERPVRSSRETASRAIWVRLLRAELERLPLRSAVTGLALRVDAAGAAAAPQGDLFDLGLQSARAVEDALTRLLDDGQATIVGLTTTAHPRPEERARWRVRELAEVLGEHPSAVGSSAAAATPTLCLQLLPTPRAVVVTTASRRGQCVPAAYRDESKGRRAAGGEGLAVELLAVAGPDQISGGAETGVPYARAYFQCVTAEGMLVLLYHDTLAGAWYVHGWWD